MIFFSFLLVQFNHILQLIIVHQGGVGIGVLKLVPHTEMGQIFPFYMKHWLSTAQICELYHISDIFMFIQKRTGKCPAMVHLDTDNARLQEKTLHVETGF